MIMKIDLAGPERRGLAMGLNEAAGYGAAGIGADPPFRQVVLLTSVREQALSAACQAGMVNNLNDGLAWGVFPLLFAQAGLRVGQIGVLAAYPRCGRSASSSPARCRIGGAARA
jgi:hypothetical protein